MAKTTIYSIAQELGVHASTVSRAFSRPELVKADVRQRVLEAAERLGFEPNKTARRLATGSTGAVGLLVPDITNPYFPPLVRSIQSAAADRTVILVDAEGDASTESSLIARLKSQVDGLLLASPLASDAELREAVGSMPTVVLNREVEGLSSVIGDVTTALHAAGDHLLELGHRRIALLAGTVGSWAARERQQAIQRWAARVEVDLTELGPYEASYEGGREAALALLQTSATAAFAFDDLTACGVIAGLADAGCRVPDDRSVVGCDDVLLARVVTPTLTTVSTPDLEIGREALEALGRVTAGGEPATVRMSGTFIPRQSSGSVPRRE